MTALTARNWLNIPCPMATGYSDPLAHRKCWPWPVASGLWALSPDLSSHWKDGTRPSSVSLLVCYSLLAAISQTSCWEWPFPPPPRSLLARRPWQGSVCQAGVRASGADLDSSLTSRPPGDVIWSTLDAAPSCGFASPSESLVLRKFWTATYRVNVCNHLFGRDKEIACWKRKCRSQGSGSSKMTWSGTANQRRFRMVWVLALAFPLPPCSVFKDNDTGEGGLTVSPAFWSFARASQCVQGHT